jgi:hypothetical protein
MGIFIDPLSLVYNSAEQEILFCVFLSFRTLRNSNEVRIFLESIFFPETQYEKKYWRGPTRPEQAQVVRAPP